MGIIKRIFIGLGIVLLAGVLGLLMTGNGHVLRGIRSTYLIGEKNPDIDDLGYFDLALIAAGNPRPWPISADAAELGKSLFGADDSLETTAFILVQNDTIRAEYYAADGGVDVVSNSFSMAKSFTAMMIMRACEQGYIQSLNDPVGKYLPEYQSGPDAHLTIQHLLQMTSTIPFGESYSSPFGYMARAYFGNELQEETYRYHAEGSPGSRWSYEGGNTVLLGLILKAATGKSPSTYFGEEFWRPMGSEHAAFWNLDHEGGLEKVFSGYYATARDFARIGSLMLHHGVVGQDTLLSEASVASLIAPCRVPDGLGETCTWYGSQWWIDGSENPRFFACRGMRGQYIICVPEHHLCIVRLGHRQSKARIHHMPADMLQYLNLAEKTLGLNR
ncbi:MAG: serine hydrolase domain-containing protein [Flavobacteriales bacterium]